MARDKKAEKGRYNFLIDSSVYKEFSRTCKELGIIRSKTVENHMKDFAAQQDISNLRREKTYKKGRYNFIIDTQTYKKFSVVCNDLGLVRSKKIENFMRGFIEKNK